jgi:hypothetical protein
MSLEKKLNKLLKPMGITVGVTYHRVVKKYEIECRYHDGYSQQERCYDGIRRERRESDEEFPYRIAVLLVDLICDRVAW